jgi:hypothetical protein
MMNKFWLKVEIYLFIRLTSSPRPFDAAQGHPSSPLHEWRGEEGMGEKG